jgi:hypothetical protein
MQVTLQFRDIEGMLRNVPEQQLAPGTTDQKCASGNGSERRHFGA